MGELRKRPSNLRMIALFLVVAVPLCMTALVGMYLASFATHFVWLAATKAHVESAKDFHLWLWIPTLAIVGCLLFLVSHLLERLKLRERLLGDFDNIKP
jgi:hypothetical protein